MDSVSFVEYDYVKVPLKAGLESFERDGYRAFGWEESEKDRSFGNLSLKRRRDVPRKNELVRLQRQYEGSLNDIENMEKSKKQASTVAALTTGILGAAFMALSVFSMLGSHVVLMIIFGVIGLLLWGFSYPAYRTAGKKKTEKVTPLIDKKYDEAFDICKKAGEIIKEGR
mgnify:CR=1 FL=1|jgi:hypothetical protein